MKKLRLIINLWFPVLLWCGLIFYLSSIPNLRASPNPVWDEFIRSFAHGLFYAILYVLFFRAINFKKDQKDLWLPFWLGALYGFSDELHQLFVPTRAFQFKDLLVDILGVLFGLFAVWKLLPKTPKKLKSLVKELGLS